MLVRMLDGPPPRILLLFLGTLTAIVLVVSACSGDTIPIGPQPPTTTTPRPTTTRDVAPLIALDSELVIDGLSEPVAIAASSELDAIFVVERTGTVTRNSDGDPSIVLDIVDRVGWDMNEQGLLGLALHPDFPDDPRGFLIYTNEDRDVVASSFTWDGSHFDPASEQVILTVPQPHKYHQGGGMLFGPQGYLWMSFGDGGGIGDPYRNGQNPETLNGTIIRIDVNFARPYAIPPSNPFVTDRKGDPRVWAYGLRNPWRFTIDGGRLVIADVGQADAEEINVVPIDGGGYNFGWPIMEGNGCFEAETCDTTGLTPPTLQVDRDQTCAIIGGPVYRGAAIPELYGQYIYGDFCTAWIRSAPLEGNTLGAITDWSQDIGRLGQISTFGVDPDGEILVATLEGALHRIIPAR